MKINHFVLSQISNRGQLLPYSPSKPSPLNTAVENTQTKSKNENVPSADGGQHQHQIKQVRNIIKSTMQTLSK